MPKKTDKQPTILVVEDEPPLAQAIESKLKLEGFRTVTAQTVEQALYYFKNVDDISLIWLDHYLLGKEDGVDLVSSD